MMHKALALIHYPIVNKHGEIVTTSVTNLDIHDIARTSRTFGLQRFFIVTPLEKQQELIERILSFWRLDQASEYNPDRCDALELVEVVATVEAAIERMAQLNNSKPPLVVVTSAQADESTSTELTVLRGALQSERPVLICFGTGHGLAPVVIKSADFRLKPIEGLADDGYNHLSVRSAVAIYCDRLARSLEAI